MSDGTKGLNNRTMKVLCWVLCYCCSIYWTYSVPSSFRHW